MAGVSDDTTFAERARLTIRYGRLAVRLFRQASPWAVSAILLILLAQALLSPAQLALSRLVLDRAAIDLEHVAPTDALAGRWPLGAWIVLAAATLALGQLLQPISAVLQSAVGDRLSGAVTMQLMLAVDRWQGLAHFEDPDLADDIAHTRRRVQQGGLEVLTYGAGGVLACVVAVGLALLLAKLHPLLPALLVLVTLPQMARRWEYGHRMRSHLYGQTTDARKLTYQTDTLLTPEPAKDVRLYMLGPFFQQRYAAIFRRTMAGLDQLRRRLMTEVALTSALAAAAAGAVYFYVVWLVTQGRSSVGDVALYGGAATMLQANLLTVGFDLAFLPMVMAFLPSLRRILDAPADLPIVAQPLPAPRPIRDGLIFDHVAFAYPGSDRPILRDISFRLGPGQSLALVGHNGAGKTTLVKLLLHLYDPTAGRILLDGIDLREYDPAGLRREMGAVFQDFVRYELTAAENIAMGQLDAMHDLPRLLDAARRAGAIPLIEGLSEGLATQLGREFGGRELSGGEWQKLALARAFVRDCQLLVLDEPTAALDVQTEYDIYTRFHELSAISYQPSATSGRAESHVGTGTRMTVLISHRFSTVRMADRILYLADGRIQEEGSHEELLRLDGEYARLYRLQAAQYLDNGTREVTA